MDLSVLTFVLVLWLAFANGSNDVSKAVATLVGSGVANYRTAILWGTGWTMVGAGLAGLVATAMVKTFSQGLLAPEVPSSPLIAAAVLIGAVVWVLVASWSGLPVSTTHALTGAIVGVGLVAFGSEGLLWNGIGKKILLPLILGPMLALLVAGLLHSLVRTLAARWEGACLCVMPPARALIMIDAHGTTRTLFQTAALGQPVMAVPSHCDREGLRGLVVGLDGLHWCSSGLASLARGMNDAPKIAAMLLLGTAVTTWSSPAVQTMVFFAVAVAMGIGSYMAGLRVTRVLAENVTRMDHSEGLTANCTTSSLVFASAMMGLPVSTTHVGSSAIIGIGLLKGVRGVQWTTVRDMVLAWVVTLPVSGLLATFAYYLLIGLS